MTTDEFWAFITGVSLGALIAATALTFTDKP